MTENKSDWKTRLNNNDRIYLKHILAFYASADYIFNANLIASIKLSGAK